LYGVPAFVQMTLLPSPMSQVTLWARAVAVTVIPPAVADAAVLSLRCDADIDGRQIHVSDRELRDLTRGSVRKTVDLVGLMER